MDEYAVINIVAEVEAEQLNKRRDAVDKEFDGLVDRIRDIVKSFCSIRPEFQCKVELDIVP